LRSSRAAAIDAADAPSAAISAPISASSPVPIEADPESTT